MRDQLFKGKVQVENKGKLSFPVSRKEDKTKREARKENLLSAPFAFLTFLLCVKINDDSLHPAIRPNPDDIAKSKTP